MSPAKSPEGRFGGGKIRGKEWDWKA